MRWMYPVERYMKILKGYVKNQCRSEASIIERYISEESIDFCSEYMSKAKCIGVPEKGWHSCRCISKSSKGVHVISKSREEVLQAHLYIYVNFRFLGKNGDKWAKEKYTKLKREGSKNIGLFDVLLAKAR